MLVNLDAHPDRTLGARALECTIIAHQKTAQVFRSRPSVFKGQNAESGAEWETYDDAVGTRWAAPDITFAQRIELHWGPPDVILESHPGPTPGSIWAIIPAAQVIFVGDAVLHNQPPFLAYGDIDAWQESLDVLLDNYRDYTIVSGRGGPVPFEAIRQEQKYLKNVLKGLERLAKRNAPTDDVERLVPGLLDDFSFPKHMEEQYAQRLKHGLAQYYAHHYRPTDIVNQTKNQETEQ